MKEKLKQIVDTFHRYNSENMATQAFGLSPDTLYDALVVAPSFTPYKLGMDAYCTVTALKEGAYIAGYLVEKDGLKIAWIKIGSSAGNLIDHLSLCAELTFRQLIFIGAAGALKPSFHLGDVCVPAYSLSGSQADAYLLKSSIRESTLFEKVFPETSFSDQVIRLGQVMGHLIQKASVFCTPSIALEYTHLEEIRTFDTDLIEMETSSFYLMAQLFELPAAALLVVSDNSATGAALVGRTAEQQRQYEYGRNVILPEMLLSLAQGAPIGSVRKHLLGLEGKTLHSERLSYRLLRETDRPFFRALLADADLTEPAGFLPLRTDAEFDHFWLGLREINRGIAILLHDVPIGYLSVYGEQPEEPEYRDRLCLGLGFVIGKPHQGQGYGTEMLGFMTRYLKQQFSAQSPVLFADAFLDNPVSNRVIQKCGYRYLEDYTLYFDALGREMTCHSYIF